MRFRDLYLCGPSQSEVTHRETYMAETDELIDVTSNFATCKDKCAWLPPPIPRSLRTVFHFKSTSKAVPPDASSSKGPGAASLSGPPRATVALGEPLPARPTRRQRRWYAVFAEQFARLPQHD